MREVTWHRVIGHSLPAAGRVGTEAAEIEVGVGCDARRQFAGLSSAEDVDGAIGQALRLGGIEGTASWCSASVSRFSAVSSATSSSR